MAIKLLDIIRPGVTLVDDEGNTWKYAGRLSPDEKTLKRLNDRALAGDMVSQKWENKWLCEDEDQGVLSIEEIHKEFGPISVTLANWNPDLAWFNKHDTFEVEDTEEIA